MGYEFDFVEGKDSFLGWFFLHSFCNLSPEEQKPYFDAINETGEKRKTHTLKFTANGVEFPVKETFERMEKERDREIKEEAVKLVVERFHDISQEINDLNNFVFEAKQSIVNRMREKLELEETDDDNY